MKVYFLCESVNILPLHRGSYMSAHVLLNLLNELGKRDKMRGLPNVRFYLSYGIKITLKSHFCRKYVILLSLCTQRCYGRHNVSRKSISHYRDHTCFFHAFTFAGSRGCCLNTRPIGRVFNTIRGTRQVLMQ